MKIHCAGALMLALFAWPGATRAQAPTDSAAIRATALDYIEGWYTGDAERMARAVHPRIAKRIVGPKRGTGRSVVDEMSAAALIEATRQGGGKHTPPERRRADVRILDIFGSAASVRVDAAEWVDYLHLAKVDGEWKIINVLWELRPREARVGGPSGAGSR
jgi:hypothetical protein